MAVDPDEEALTWAGEEDSRPAATSSDSAAGKPKAAATKVSGSPEIREVVAPQEKTQVSSVLLVTYGVLAGGYLIYTLGWVVSIQRFAATHPASTDPLTAIMFAVTEFLAIASPTLWFGVVLALTRGAKPIMRLVWLLLGLVAVIPWPFVIGAWAHGR